jgi:hypothetical protein
MRKKSQIKMFETIAILVIFFFLVGFGFIFYARVHKTTSQIEFSEAQEFKAIQISERAAFLPEIQCSSHNEPIDDCIDIEKLEAFSNAVSNNLQYYYNLFEFSNIIVEEVYPDQESWTLYDNPKQDFKDQISIQLPILLNDPTSDGVCGTQLQGKCYFGVMHVSIYI